MEENKSQTTFSGGCWKAYAEMNRESPSFSKENNLLTLWQIEKN